MSNIKGMILLYTKGAIVLSTATTHRTKGAFSERCQLPLTPAFAFTAFKAQGLTFKDYYTVDLDDFEL